MYALLYLFHSTPYTDSSWEVSKHLYSDTTASTLLCSAEKGIGVCVCQCQQLAPPHPQHLVMSIEHRTDLGFKSILPNFPRPVSGHIPNVWAAALHAILTCEMAKSSSQMSHLGTTKLFIIISKCKYGGMKGEASLKPFSENQEYSLRDPSPIAPYSIYWPWMGRWIS